MRNFGFLKGKIPNFAVIVYTQHFSGKLLCAIGLKQSYAVGSFFLFLVAIQSSIIKKTFLDTL